MCVYSQPRTGGFTKVYTNILYLPLAMKARLANASCYLFPDDKKSTCSNWFSDEGEATLIICHFTNIALIICIQSLK